MQGVGARHPASLRQLRGDLLSGHKEGVKLQGHEAEAAGRRQLKRAGTPRSHWWARGRFRTGSPPIGPPLETCALSDASWQSGLLWRGVGCAGLSNTELTN